MSDENIKKNIKKCARCALCLKNCPIYEIKQDENNSARGLICKLNGYFEGMLEKKEIKRDLKICLNCSKCKSNCPSKVDTIAAFSYKNANLFPSLISQRLFLKLKLLPIKILYILNLLKPQPQKTKSEILYFKGCIAKSQHKKTLLDKMFSSADFKCCGIPHLTSGDIKNYEKLKNHNINIIKQAKKVIFDCASCKSAVMEYSELDKKDKEKLTLFLNGIKSIKIKEKYKGKTVTFHKPCHMTKEDFEQIEALLLNTPDIKYKKLPNCELCCGFGGSYFMFHPIISYKINKKCTKQIKSQKPDIILTMCPSCTMGLRFGQLINFGFKKTLEIRDIIEDMK